MAAHEPVMTAEVLGYLAPQHGGVFVDCTVGLGGHGRALIVGGASRVVGLDRDRESLSVARTALSPWADRVELVHADFRHVSTSEASPPSTAHSPIWGCRATRSRPKAVGSASAATSHLTCAWIGRVDRRQRSCSVKRRRRRWQM